MSGWRAYLLLVGLVLFLSFVGMVFINQWWMTAPALLTAAFAAASVGFWRRCGAAVERDELVRRVVTTVAEAGSTKLDVHTVVIALGTPEVTRAWELAREREEKLWENRFRSER